MCFSATASFGSGMLLSAIGVASLRKVRTGNRRLFAAIPLLFGVQQFSEGFVWLGLQDSSYEWIVPVCAAVFSFYAHTLWPTVVPLSIMLMEPQAERRKVLQWTLAVGVLTSLYFLVCQLSFPGTAMIDGYHIRYVHGYPMEFATTVGIFYMVSTIIPHFVSSLRRASLFGITTAIAYGVTYVLYNDYIVSVWCFFSALLSAIVYYILYPAPTHILSGEHNARHHHA